MRLMYPANACTLDTKLHQKLMVTELYTEGDGMDQQRLKVIGINMFVS